MSIFIDDKSDYVPVVLSPHTPTPPPQDQPATLLPDHVANVMAQLQAAQSRPVQPGNGSPPTAPQPLIQFITQDLATQSTLRKAYLISAKAIAENAVLILGPTGTGKELLAKIIHGSSSPYPFISVNAASLTDTLLQSTLYGHVKGAFTGAINDFPGVFRAAGQGTVFLDEIGDMPLHQQSSLLRVLQQREVVPVGTTGERPYPIRCRIIAATNADVSSTQLFRNDLYARFRHTLRLPPLSERPCDIPLLLEHFKLPADTQLDPDLLARFNVRYLEHLAADWQLYH